MYIIPVGIYAHTYEGMVCNVRMYSLSHVDTFEQGVSVLFLSYPMVWQQLG